MASIDKIAIVVTLAVVLVAVGVVAMANSSDNAPTTPTQQMNTDAADARAAEAAADAKAAARAEAAAEARAEAAAEARADAAAEARAEAAAEARAEAAATANAGPQTHIVEPTKGSANPGCEASNACYSPADITINVGDTVQWNNSDDMPHTMTSGSPKEGPNDVFDSGLKMKGDSFEFTFNSAGTYGYFCQVHPWMTGSVTAN